jgi:hypothetical protein
MRNRIKTDLGLNIPLAKIIQSASVHALADYLAEHLANRAGSVAQRAEDQLLSSAPVRVDATASGHRMNTAQPGQAAAE